MSNRFTVITLNEPESPALAWAVAEVNPEFYLVIDPESEQWEVYDVDDETPLFTVDLPYLVQVPGEMRRLFGSDAGFSFSELGGEPPTYWQDVHVARDAGERAEGAASRFAQLAAHLGLGTVVDHTAHFNHLGEPEQIMRKDWTS